MQRTLYRTMTGLVAGTALVAGVAGIYAAPAIATDHHGRPAAGVPLVRTVSLESSVHLAGGLSSSTTQGSFAVAGSLTDSGTESGSGYFDGGGATPTGPNILHATQTFTGKHGTITVSLTGDFGPLPAPTAEGAGYWTVASGTGDYAQVRAVGRWNAVADFTGVPAHLPPTVTFMLVGITT